jgi:hypothetical protein
MRPPRRASPVELRRARARNGRTPRRASRPPESRARRRAVRRRRARRRWRLAQAAPRLPPARRRRGRGGREGAIPKGSAPSATAPDRGAPKADARLPLRGRARWPGAGLHGGTQRPWQPRSHRCRERGCRDAVLPQPVRRGRHPCRGRAPLRRDVPPGVRGPPIRARRRSGHERRGACREGNGSRSTSERVVRCAFYGSP